MKSTLCSYLPELKSRTTQTTAVKFKIDERWEELSWVDFSNKIVSVFRGLKTFQLRKKDTIGIMSQSRLEWSIVDWATLGGQFICVPIYPNLGIDDLEYIIQNSEIKVLFLENKTLLKHWFLIKAKCPQVRYVIVLDFDEDDLGVLGLNPINKNQEDSDTSNGHGNASGSEKDTNHATKDLTIMSFNKFINRAQESLEFTEKEFYQLNQQISPQDTATIIYTSGTTGTPKGVELTHGQIFSATEGAFNKLRVNEKDITLSVLPFSHILGRIEHFGHLFKGFTLAYSENNEKIRLNLKEIQPTILLGVPRIFEKICISIKLKAETNLIQRNLFKKATQIGLDMSHRQQSHLPISLMQFLKYFTVKSLVLDNIKSEIFGDRLRFIVSGGAPLSSDVCQFFHSIGVLALEGYGLTETTGPITVNTVFDYHFGSVGKAIGETQIKIADDGEILIKGSTIMKGYYKDPSATQAIIIDGWLHTGDIGELKNDGKLIITDRKKDLIKTANGKYVAPQKLESLFMKLPFINHAHIHGDNKKYIVALLTLNQKEIFEFAAARKITFNSMEDLIDKEPILELVRSGVAKINKTLASHESIKKFALVANDFTIESGELTPSHKVKRKVVDERYKTLIQSLY